MQGFQLWLISFNDKLFQLIEPQIISHFTHILNGFNDKGKSHTIRYLCEQNSISPDQCILFDDIQENINQVEAIGVQGCLVNHESGVTEADILNELTYFIWNQFIQVMGTAGLLHYEPLKPVIVVAATNSEERYAVARIFPWDRYTTVDVSEESKVKHSFPIGEVETKQCALNRFDFISKHYPDAHAWIVIQIGLVPDEFQERMYSDVAFVVLQYNNNNSREKASRRIVKSAAIQTSYTADHNQDHSDLERYQEEISQVHNRVCEYFSQGKLTRIELLSQAIKIAAFNNQQQS
jgi:non-canonical (house-cleaning) NTP pyrophosphatase